jgi:hypothetical protein
MTWQQAQPRFRLSIPTWWAMARIAHAAGWRVVAVTTIPRTSWFGGPTLQAAFPANAAALNASISASPDFDAVADPSHSITSDMY